MSDLFNSLQANVKVLPSHREVFEQQATISQYRGAPAKLPRQPAVAVESIVEPVADPPPIHVESVPPPQLLTQSQVNLDPEPCDADLKYEMSAVSKDQELEKRLRHELVYVSPNLDAPIDISGNENIWFEATSPVQS